MKLVKAFAANESGAAPIEYILIAVGIVLVRRRAKLLAWGAVITAGKNWLRSTIAASV